MQGLFQRVRVFVQFFRKRAKYLKIWAKMYNTCKYFEKGQPHGCGYHVHEIARICPEIPKIS